MRDVRAGRRRDRQPGGRDLRGVRLVRDPCQVDFLTDVRAAPVCGARGHGRGLRVARHAGSLGRPRCRGLDDGRTFGVMFVGVVSPCWPGYDVAAAGLHPPVSLPGPISSILIAWPAGHGVGGRAVRHLAVVAGARARSGAQRGDRGRPRGGAPSAGAGGLCPRRRRRSSRPTLRSQAEARSGRTPRSSRISYRPTGRRRTVVRLVDELKWSTPPSGRQRRTRTQQHRSEVGAVKTAAARCSNAAPTCWTRRSAPRRRTRRRPSCARA